VDPTTALLISADAAFRRFIARGYATVPQSGRLRAGAHLQADSEFKWSLGADLDTTRPLSLSWSAA
jgi:hypothetical protein